MNADTIEIFTEEEFVRWRVIDRGTEYLDGGNYRTVAQAIKGVAEAVGFPSVASEQADQLAVDKDQDWDNEATTFTFSDGSKLRCSGGEAELVR